MKRGDADELVQDMIALYAAGMTTNEVGEELGCSGSLVCRRLAKLGLTRTPTQSMALRKQKCAPVQRVSKSAPRCPECGIVVAEPGLCRDCVAEAEAGIVYTGIDIPTPPRRAENLDAIRELLVSVLPEGGEVQPKAVSMLVDWTANAVCPYCRVMIWFGGFKHAEGVDGATFCAQCDGLCGTEPGPCREAAFVEYVAEQVRLWEIRERQDKPVAAARYCMDRAGEVMWNEVNTYEVERQR